MDKNTKLKIREIKNAILISLGVLSAGFGLNGFLLSSNFIDGGITGVSMLISKLSGIPLGILLVLVNLPFMVIGFRQLGGAFALRSCIAIAGLCIAITIFPYPDVTPDKFLTSVFGGFFIGAGIGFAIRGGAVLDGTEIAALLISKHSSLVRVGDVILMFNIVLFTIAIKFLGVESGLYSILTYYTAAKTLDYILHGIDEYSGITIISEESEQIRELLVNSLGRGVTVYSGKGGNSGEARDILYCVVTRLEIGRVRNLVYLVDEKAFIVVHALADVFGGMVKKSAHY